MTAFPDPVMEQSEWRAVLYVFESAFPDDERVWNHVYLEERSIDFDSMIEAGGFSFSVGEVLLLLAAASLFHADGSVNLWNIAVRLSDNHWNIGYFPTNVTFVS